MFRFHKTYFLLTITLFIIEVCIALFVRDQVVRPYVGDFLVVILVYCFARSFLAIPVLTAAIGTLLFAYAVETAQYFNIIHLLGVQDSRVASIVIGNAFDWHDIIVYTIGILAVVLVERLQLKTFTKKTGSSNHLSS